MKLIIVIVVLFMGPHSWASLHSGNSYEKLAENLASLREEVEGINSQVKNSKEAYKADLKTLVIKKAELEASLQSLDVEIQQAQQKSNQLKGKIQNAYGKSWELTPLLKEFSEKLYEYIKASIPYKKQKRLQAIEQIRDKVDKKEESPLLSLQSLWQSLDDEVRLSKEIALTKQVIEIDSKTYHSEVLHLGTTMMFFRIDHTKVGRAEKDNGKWKYKLVFDKSSKAEITELFEGIKKQIRTGLYKIPVSITL